MKLTTEQRKRLGKSSFVFPSNAPGGGSFPIPDKAHARNALARAAQSDSPSVRKKVRADVHRKFPSIGEDRSEPHSAHDHGRRMKKDARMIEKAESKGMDHNDFMNL